MLWYATVCVALVVREEGARVCVCARVVSRWRAFPSFALCACLCRRAAPPPRRAAPRHAVSRPSSTFVVVGRWAACAAAACGGGRRRYVPFLVLARSRCVVGRRSRLSVGACPARVVPLASARAPGREERWTLARCRCRCAGRVVVASQRASVFARATLARPRQPSIAVPSTRVCAHTCRASARSLVARAAFGVAALFGAAAVLWRATALQIFVFGGALAASFLAIRT